MDIQTTKLDLINLLLQEQKEFVLEEVKNIFLKNKNSNEIDIIKELLSESEKEYLDGKTEVFTNILNESKAKYFSK